MAALHDNVDRRQRLYGIGKEPRIVKDGARYLGPDAVIVGRRRQRFDLVVYLLHSFNVFHDVFSVTLEDGVAHLAQQGHGVAVDFKSQIVKDA